MGYSKTFFIPEAKGLNCIKPINHAQCKKMRQKSNVLLPSAENKMTNCSSWWMLLH